MKSILLTQRGITLIEALLAAAVIGVLIFVFLWDGGTESARLTSCQTTNDKIIKAIQEYDYQVAINDPAEIKKACDKINVHIDKYNNDKCGEIEGLNPYERKNCP